MTNKDADRYTDNKLTNRHLTLADKDKHKSANTQQKHNGITDILHSIYIYTHNILPNVSSDSYNCTLRLNGPNVESSSISGGLVVLGATHNHSISISTDASI